MQGLDKGPQEHSVVDCASCNTPKSAEHAQMMKHALGAHPRVLHAGQLARRRKLGGGAAPAHSGGRRRAGRRCAAAEGAHIEQLGGVVVACGMAVQCQVRHDEVLCDASGNAQEQAWQRGTGAGHSCFAC